MKEMWTGVYPNKKEYKYEIRFRTDDEHAYLFVQEACRNAIDINWCDEKPDPDPRLKTVTQETFKAKKHNDFKWFKIDEMTWNDCGWFDCECGCRVSYEKV